MNKISGWQALYMSFYSGDLYREVARNWHGVGYLYMTCVIAGSCLAMSIAAHIVVNVALTKYVDPIVAKWPTVTVQDGKLSIDKPTPYVIDISETTCVGFVASDEDKLPSGKDGFLVSPTSVQQVLPDGTDRPMGNYDGFKGTSQLTVDRNFFQTVVTGFKTWTGPGLFLFVTPFMIVFCIVQTLIYGLIGLIVSNVMDVGLSFGQIVRIASVALTPYLVLDAAVHCTGHFVPYGGLIAMAMAIGYVVFGVRANVSSNGSLTTSAG